LHPRNCHSEFVEERSVKTVMIIKVILQHTPLGHEGNGQISQAQHDNSGNTSVCDFFSNLLNMKYPAQSVKIFPFKST